MEQALCMAHWLKRCKVNEPIYILLPSGWSDEADAPYSALLCYGVQHGGMWQVQGGRSTCLISFNPSGNGWFNESLYWLTLKVVGSEFDGHQP